MAEFLAMGGYAAYVWGAYGLAAAVIAGLVIASVRRLGAAERTLATLEGVRRRRRAREAGDDA